MAASFPPDARVLRFNPGAPQGYQGRRYDLLWPVLAYRVGVPVSPRPEQMDLFQRAVFGVLLHGINEVQKIADILHLHPDLVRIIKVFLVDRRMIDHHDIVSVDAERRYREARFDLGEQPDGFTTGYVFQDPFSGLLLPRLIETLETADFKVQESGFPELHLGERVVRPYVEFYPGNTHQPPSAADVMRAFEASRRARRGHWELEEEGTGPTFLTRVSRVNFIEEKSELMYLSTFIFGHGLSGWEVADPFGLPTSPLTALAHKRLAHSKLLGRFVQRLAVEESREVPSTLDPYDEALGNLRHEFGTQVDDHPLLQVLLDAELGAGEFRAAPEGQRQRRARQLLGATRSLLEALLREVRARHSTAGVERQLLDGDRLYNLQRIEGAAVALSFDVPLPSTLTSVKRSDVFAMANRDYSGKLRPLLVSVLLSAASHAGHPLYAAARSEPHFLQQFDEVLSWCGEAAHIAENPGSVQEQAAPALERAYRAVQLLALNRAVAAPPAPVFRVAPEPQALEFDDLDL